MPLRFNYEPQETRANLIVPSLYTSYNPTALPTALSNSVMYKNMDVKKVDPTTEGVAGKAYTPSLASVFKSLKPSSTPTSSFTPSSTSDIDWDSLDNARIWTDDRNIVRSDHPLLDSFIQKESRGNATVNKNGVLQILDGAWKDYGEGRDPSLKLNPQESGKVAINYLKDIKKNLDKNGIPATALNAWIMYNQGIGGGKLIFSNMDTAIKDVNEQIYNNMLGNMSNERRKYYTLHPNELTGRAFIGLHAPDFIIK